MPAIVIDRPPPRSEQMWQALKTHIIRQRQKKKQEQEADAEVERQRKEREQQKKQDKMTLGETREQLSQLEQRLQQLKDEKHQLFLQLKKVLNEDDNRRRQLVKDSTNDMMEMYGYPGVQLGNPPMFLQQNLQLANRNPMYKVPPSHTLLPAGTLKRRRSPSPANYPQYGTYKPANSQAPYQKVDENRRGHEYVRAVLWNKPYGLTENSQYGPFYTTSTTLSYSAAPTQPQQVYSQTTYNNPAFQPTQLANSSSSQSSEQPAHTAQPPKHHYLAQHSQQRPHNPSYLHVTIDAKAPFPEDNFYSSAQIRPASHVPLHGGAIPIQQPPQGAKTGGITSGYPIRPASAPTATTPHSVYVSQSSSGSRLVYSQPVTSQPSIRYSVPPMQRET